MLGSGLEMFLTSRKEKHPHLDEILPEGSNSFIHLNVSLTKHRYVLTIHEQQSHQKMMETRHGIILIFQNYYGNRTQQVTGQGTTRSSSDVNYSFPEGQSLPVEESLERTPTKQ